MFIYVYIIHIIFNSFCRRFRYLMIVVDLSCETLCPILATLLFKKDAQKWERGPRKMAEVIQIIGKEVPEVFVP